MTLRREVYLPVLAEFNSAVTFLAAMPSYPVEAIQKADALQAFAAAAAKFGLVSSSGAAVAIHKLTTECGLLYLQFATQAMEVAQIREETVLHAKFQNEHVVEMNRINAALRAINETGVPDDTRFDALAGEYESVKKQWETQNQFRHELAMRQHQAFAVYGREFLPALKVVQDTSIEAIVAMRSDLGQKDSSDEMARELKANSERMYSSAKALIDAQTTESSNGDLGVARREEPA